ncbi:hypothetical protein ROZALSC1DRAFT_12145 [Rozella allomycis CSF55]|uniref:Cyclin N-terminal domain-containing protein n=1 Tax=Rozella allomycis (strain CSF55) TaxID=988480 RepID=A0A4P9YMH5_ROZAC|nr:hypothetical protein ROZALSC1DRAFT_12145 [Rozella allomycis CSF55]
MNSTNMLSEYLAEYLVDVITNLLGSVWSSDTNDSLPLNKFVKEFLKKAKTSYSVLIVSIFYLMRFRKKLSRLIHLNSAVACRKCFLMAVILSSKFLDDVHPSNFAWAKFSGIDIQEINDYEKMLLDFLDYDLYISKECFYGLSCSLAKYCEISISGIQLPIKKNKEYFSTYTRNDFCMDFYSLNQCVPNFDASNNPYYEALQTFTNVV